MIGDLCAASPNFDTNSQRAYLLGKAEHALNAILAEAHEIGASDIVMILHTTAQLFAAVRPHDEAVSC